MRDRTLVIIGCILLLNLISHPSPVFADELLLREGKTLTGKITKEDEEEYTILLGKGMVLRVLKTSVSKVTRDQPLVEPAQSIRYTAPKKVSISTITVSGPEILNPKTDDQVKDRTKNNFRISERVVTKIYTVRGENLDAIKLDISDPDMGKGVQIKRKREASHAQWASSWDGQKTIEEGKHLWKSGVIAATVTLTLPIWKASESPSAQVVQAWNKYISSLNSFEAGRIKIFSEELEGFSEALSLLRADSEESLKMESQILYEKMKTQAEMRQQGYVRRASSRPAPTKTP